MTKTALITGAASGIGYELALLLAKDAYKLILVDIDAEKLAKAKKKLNYVFDVEIVTISKDLSQPNVAQEIINNINNEPIDVLINNAGFGLFGYFSETDWEREYAMLQVHITTTTHLTKLALKNMVKRGSGSVLNISSLAAFQPGPLMSIYYASKGYILSFSEAIANELKGTGVTVTALCPGPTETSFQKTVSKNAKNNKYKFNIAGAKTVAAYGYQAMKKGETVAIPGNFNKLLATLPRFLSRNAAVNILRRIQEKNRAY